MLVPRHVGREAVGVVQGAPRARARRSPRARLQVRHAEALAQAALHATRRAAVRLTADLLVCRVRQLALRASRRAVAARPAVVRISARAHRPPATRDARGRAAGDVLR
eukprot:941182-Prymnesium_polylepis.1